MIVPRQALLRPRVLAAQTGDSLPLDAVLRDLFATPARGLVRLTGAAGSGKTTALAYLAHVFPGRDVHLVDDPRPADLAALLPARWGVFTSPHADDGCRATHSYRLAPWRQDEWIEYLLAAHKDRCASVMTRLRGDAGLTSLRGNPQLCRLVLDRLAADESLPSARAALSGCLGQLFPAAQSRAAAERAAFDLLLSASAPGAAGAAPGAAGDDARGGLLRHRPVQLLLATAHLLRDLREEASCRALGLRLPRDLVREAGAEAARAPATVGALRAALGGRPEWHAMAASLLHAGGVGWVPEAGTESRLAGAYLGGASWPGVTLTGADLTGTDLSRADLRQAALDRTRAVGVNLRHTDLSGASLLKFFATGADLAHANLSRSDGRDGSYDGSDLEGADLRGADLRGASFAGANLARAGLGGADLRNACLAGATLDGADLSGADLGGAILSTLKLNRACLTGARFRGAILAGSDLEGVNLPAVDLREADLRNALLTDSSMPGGCFDGARLVGAGLAAVDWEGASLRGADLIALKIRAG